MNQTAEVLKRATRFVETSWSKTIAQRRNGAWLPQGEWVQINPKKPEEGCRFEDATSWSCGGAILRAEFQMNREFKAVEGAVEKDKPAYYHPMFTTDAIKYVQMAAKELGFKYVADFNDDKKTDQTKAVALMNRAVELFQLQCVN